MKLPRFLLLLVFIFIFYPIISAQTDSSKTAQVSCSQYLKTYATHSLKMASGPFRWTSGQWAGALITAGTGIFLYSQDLSIHSGIQKSRLHALDEISKHGIEKTGNGFYISGSMSLLYVSGLIFNNPRAKKLALKGIQSYLISGLAVTALKYGLQRHRPYQDSPPNSKKWEGPDASFPSFKSFPSGHATSVFAIASVIAWEYRKNKWVPWVCYPLACISAFSRIYDGKHWASDVWAGAALGFATGHLVSRFNPWDGPLYKRKNKKKSIE